MYNPLVSVILPVYNAENYIVDSVSSILNQTFKNFELIIIDDCSTDSTLSIINDFTDNRIRIIQKEKNSGYTISLNLGIQEAKGAYIARMDADDIAREDRFEKQIEVFEKNSKIILCGSNATIIGNTSKIQKFEMPETHTQIFKTLLFENCIIHPSVMFLKAALKDLCYDTTKEPAEDFDLWTKLIFKGEFYNIQENLLNYRIHQTNISIQKMEIQMLQHSISLFEFYKKLNPKISDLNKQYFLDFFKNGKINDFKHFAFLFKLYIKLKNNSLEININLLIYKKILYLTYEYIKQLLENFKIKFK